MKKLFFIFIVTLGVLLGYNSSIESKLEGKWAGVSKAGRKVTVIFKDNNEFSIQVMNGIAKGVYSIYGESSPYFLDVDLGEKGKFVTIVSLDDGFLKIEDSAINKARPLSFSKNSVMLVKR